MTRRWLLSLPFVAPFVKKVAAQTYTTPMMAMPPASGKILRGFILDVDTGDGRKTVFCGGSTGVTLADALSQNPGMVFLLPPHVLTPQYPANADS